MAPRASLTKKQLETPEGAELLVLLQGVAADGVVEDDEISRLVGWLDAHQDSELPPVAVLREAAAKIGKAPIEDAARERLHDAIERVLPREVRELVSRERYRAKQEKSAAELADWLKTCGPRGKQFHFPVAGATKRQEVILEHATEGMRVLLERDPADAYSSHAVKVLTAAGVFLGYVAEKENQAAEISSLLDQGYRQRMEVATLWKTPDGAVVPIVEGVLREQGSGADGSYFLDPSVCDAPVVQTSLRQELLSDAQAERARELYAEHEARAAAARAADANRTRIALVVFALLVVAVVGWVAIWAA